MSKKKREFKRQDSHRFKRLNNGWRRPRGRHSKMRRHKKGKPPVVNVGYRGPKYERGIHPSGYREVLVRNTEDVKDVDPEIQAIRIASKVGSRKREKILELAEDRGIKVLNAG